MPDITFGCLKSPSDPLAQTDLSSQPVGLRAILDLSPDTVLIFLRVEGKSCSTFSLPSPEMCSQWFSARITAGQHELNAQRELSQANHIAL